MKIKPVYLPWWGAIVQTLQFGHAGYTYLGDIGILLGGAMGSLVSIAVAYSAARVNSVAAERKKSSWMFFILLLCVSPIFVGMAMDKAIAGVMTDDVPRWIVAAVWGLIPDGSVALSGVITGGSLVDLRTGKKTTGTSTNRTGTTRKPDTNQKRADAMKKKVQCPHCLESMTQAKLNNHKSKCAETNVFVRAKGK